MIKRREDYEMFCGMKRDWLQLWQVGNSVYKVENLFLPQYWRDVWCDFRPGRRLRAIMVTLKHMITYYSEAPTTGELDRQEACYRDIASKFWEYIAG